MKRILIAALLAILCLPAYGQWQTPDHSVPVGRGVGVTGFKSVGPCAIGYVITGNGAAADPTCQSSPSISIKAPVYIATTANITLSGEQTIDGVLTSASRVLVKNQSTASQNGCYVSAAGAWARCADWNTTGQIVQGTQVYVNSGTLNGGVQFNVTTSGTITIGSTAVTIVPTKLLPGVLVYAQKYGALCDGTTNDATAIATALATGNRITSGGATCAVSGQITMPDGVWFQNIKFKQLDPNPVSNDRITLKKSSGVGPVHLEDVTVNRNGSPTDGSPTVSPNNAGGVQIYNGTANRAVFVGYISGTTLTVTSVTSGTIQANQIISGDTIDLVANTIITADAGGGGGIGDYTINNSQTIASSGSPTNITGAIPVSNIYIKNLEVYGDGPGFGFRCYQCSNVEADGIYVHDINVAQAVDPGTEQIVGSWWGINSSNINVTNTRISKLMTNFGGTGYNVYQTDGEDFSGCINCTFTSGKIAFVNEGNDISGSTPNVNLQLIGYSYDNIGNVGQKWAHIVRNSGSIGTRCSDNSRACVAMSGATDGAPTNISVDDVIAVNTGSDGHFAATADSPAALLVLKAAGGIDPVNIQFSNWKAIDNQATHTMKWGLSNSTTSTTVNSFNGSVSGALTADYNGIQSYVQMPLAGTGLQVFALNSTVGPMQINAPALTSPSATELQIAGTSIGKMGYYPSASSPAGVDGVILWDLGARQLSIGTNNGIALGFDGTTRAASFTSTSSSAQAVGQNGATNPAFKVDTSTVSSATGYSVKSAAAGGGAALSVISSGTNENATFDAKGSGTITLGGTSTGAITLARATTISGALTYGGVTLSNSVTGTGSLPLSASPTFTGTANFAGISATGQIVSTSTSANGTFSQIGTSAGSTLIGLVLRNLGTTTVNTAVGIEFRPNVSDGTTRAAAITSYQAISGNTADLRFTINNGAGQVEALRLNTDKSALFGDGVTATTFFKATTYLQNGVTTVGALPTCNAGAEGSRYGVSDATAGSAVFGSTLVGGSTIHTSAYCNGTNWVGG